MRSISLFNIVVINLIPLIMILGSFYLKKLAKGKIRKITGFRSGLSMKNQENWKFANEYASKLWLKFGIILEVVNIAIIFLIKVGILSISFINNDLFIVLVAFIQIGFLIYTTIKVEQKLTNKE
ncbi:SdpI family protein [Miniphocaeibacter massiliensis]|uniref:SdpI family protein n=1 Tax=Miniphocaeibacter massiliensis TaxID=2041841 RepID=UPI000C07E8E7|nr:SdpI family protein [Miniphocaeibacter massiliensis]